MNDGPIGAPHLDDQAQDAWRQHCSRVRCWVEEGALTLEDEQHLCGTRGMLTWVRAYLEERNQP
ncbi:hypothetical protein [uncultured Deinococcus sp.]|uniref:hypothetical protein n=1 Tax=uncultured Deinococcus sp. TaxID=158789 RepID=UPI00258D5733|nr:hypothetical protein [uncultured Deinococcus sp.]